MPYLIGPKKRLNRRYFCKKAKIPSWAFTRFKQGRQPLDEELLDRLEEWAGIATDSDFFDKVEQSPEAPPGAFHPK